MHPDPGIPWRRRALLQKQLHAAMTDLMAGGGDEHEMPRQLLGRNGAGQRQKIGDPRTSLADAGVPARHRRRHDDSRPLAGAKPRYDVAAADVPLIAPGDIEGHRRP
jgi:hypothetical protein